MTATDTRQSLLRHAARLMAASGTHQVTNRDIIEAAGQRNASALSYHFGNRDDLVLAILADMGPTLDAARGQLGAALDGDAPTGEIIHALVEPYGSCLHSERGRHYVQIVDQLRGQFGSSTNIVTVGEAHLDRLLGLLSVRPTDAEEPVRRERLVAMVTLMTAMVAERARQLEDGATVRIDHEAFLTNLEAMLVGVLEASTATRNVGAKPG